MSLVQSKWLLIDDLRTIPGVTKTARTYDEGRDAILNESPWECILFDHDLGELDDRKNGYSLMCLLEENPKLIPNNIMIITQNASARPKMEQLKTKLLFMKGSA